MKQIITICAISIGIILTGGLALIPWMAWSISKNS